MTTPAFETLSLSIADGVARVELNRPAKANAINNTMWAELEDCFRWLDFEPAVRAVVLSGAGRHFCAGLDLEVFAGIAEEQAAFPDRARFAESFRQTILRLQRNLTAIEQCRKPVLAAVHGSCVGGGVDMISCCDMRYCTRDASFSIKEIDLGMTADVGTLQRLPRIVPDGIVRELAYTGRTVDGGEAERIGLVNRAYDSAEAMREAVHGLARAIAAKSPLAVRGTKEMLLYTRDHSVADSLNYIATWNAGMLSTDDVIKSLEAQSAGRPAEYDD